MNRILPTTLIDGEWRALDQRREVRNPATGSVVGTVGWGGESEAREAADAAERAFRGWAARSGRERADLLLRAAEILDQRSAETAQLLASEAGKRLPEAAGEIKLSGEYLRWFAEEARRPLGSVHSPEGDGRRHMTTRSPSGVVASLTSWNFPVSLQARKIAPALAAGCTVVARVSEKAPLAATELIRALDEAGLPSGVVNIVHGPGRQVTRELLNHRAVRVVTFTGSTAVGSDIMAQAAPRVVRPLLELGGDAPFIVFGDADVDHAVDAAVVAKTRNSGQSCIGANRFLVEESIHDEFVAKLARQLDALRLGDGSTEPVADLGPLIDAEAVSGVQAMADDAVERGAYEATKPREVPQTGSFLRPMLFTDVPDDSLLATQEVFGPVAGVFRFTAEDEAIARANATEMGLAAYIFTGEVSTAWRVADRLDAGIVGVNDPVPSVAFAPMGGVKQSGIGREGGRVGLEEFTEPKYLAWRL
ncbi:NAD-dependent succinate-semialdehyde dehydrogenase [Nesterenkonia halophila]|uniref:NAD-dependent succinate-semialdehyde dehydrogenase n=1 Tax=Nesterenkonia halophila TaxID=302044 RepID=UPI0012926530|nr:NAD-dependent succinate-semialdehyde dehydrogenase [Nesterenkonia halophila]